MSDLLPSYWFARHTSSEEAELVVIGAGIVGASTAWWASRLGRRVLVLEAQRVAAGATGRSTGFLVTGGLVPFTRLAARVGEERALRLWEISQENVGLLRRELLAGGRVDCGWRAEGSWRTAIAGSAAESEWERSAERLAREGFAVDWREAAEVRRAAGSERLGGALYVEGDGGVDPLALCRDLLAMAGCEVRTGIAVRGLEPAGERVRVQWSGGEVLAESVVVAVNAHVDPLLPVLGARLRPVAVQALAAASASEATSARALRGLWAVAPQGLLLRELTDGTRLVAIGLGAAAEESESGFLDLPTADGQARLEATLQELFPVVEKPMVRHRWAGVIGTTADGLPWMRSVPGLPRAAYACGFNGGGLSLGFALGRRLARWAAEREESHLRLFATSATATAAV